MVVVCVFKKPKMIVELHHKPGSRTMGDNRNLAYQILTKTTAHYNREKSGGTNEATKDRGINPLSTPCQRVARQGQYL